MIKFFRKIRQQLLMENKNSRYFKYAIGEIILVVIGILIALQVSNWNQQRLETKNLYSYYKKIVEELEQEVLITNWQIKNIDSLRIMQKRVLEILKTKDKNDIPELITVLGAVPTAWGTSQTAEIFDEFMSQGFLSKVDDEDLKDALRELQDLMKDFQLNDIYVDNQYNTLIEPFFAKNINYALIALPRYKKTLVQGGPKTDFEALFSSMELWNVTTLKLETTNSVLLNLDDMNKGLKDLISALKKTINNQ
tara:strand:- start:1565 stop:2317 length:753 start_codon:yes stop_codon:yes gene_type:complete